MMELILNLSKDERRAQARRSLALDDRHLMDECAADFFVASGPGGQHRNKTASGVRLLHLPTGLVASATERRSQPQNRGTALDRLRKKLRALTFVPKVRRPTRATPGSRERRLAAKKKSSVTKRLRRERLPAD